MYAFKSISFTINSFSFTIETVFLKIFLFFGLDLMQAVEVWIVLELLQFCSGYWIHLDWSQQTALFSQMIQLVVKPAHVVCCFAFFFPFLVSLYYCFMLRKLGATRASPSASKSTTLLASRSSTFSCDAIVLFE